MELHDYNFNYNAHVFHLTNILITIILQINENGVLSFRSSFTSRFIQSFDRLFSFPSLVAPLWTDIDTRRGDGSVLYRRSRDDIDLGYARNLTQQQFPEVDFEPSDVVVTTWYRVGHAAGGPNVSQLMTLLQDMLSIHSVQMCNIAY